jgi:hypothetical protein
MSGMAGFVQNPEEFQGFSIPDFNGFVHASGCQQGFFGMDFQVMDPKKMGRNLVDRLPKGSAFFFPKHESGIFAAGNKPGIPWKKTESEYSLLVNFRQAVGEAFPGTDHPDLTFFPADGPSVLVRIESQGPPFQVPQLVLPGMRLVQIPLHPGASAAGSG